MPALVTMGEVGPILRLGLHDVLGLDLITVVADPDDADVALIDLDSNACRARAEILLARFPGLTVIACSAKRPTMVVLRAGMPGNKRPFTAAALRATINASSARRLALDNRGRQGDQPLSEGRRPATRAALLRRCRARPQDR